jgi:DNA polymerase-4
MVGRRARRHEYMGRTISLVVRYADFETFSRQTRLSYHSNDTHVIYQRALNILDGIRLKDRVRLLGVCLSDLIRDPQQLPLIVKERKRRALLNAMDSVNEKYGDFQLTWGSYIMQKSGSEVISPAWRPAGVKNINVK